ncbi:MAG: SPOR domain-containing protein [Gammaproteobacteria bacterium]
MSSKKPLPGFVWLMAGLGIGLFVAFLVYLEKQPAEQITFTEAVVQELEKVRQQQSGHESDNSQQSSSKPPKFDFYTILPELEVFIPESDIDKKNADSSSPQASNPQQLAGKRYLLQAGSFRNQQDAERLKASLALLGVLSSIQTVTINNDTWHRVRVGPFSNRALLRDTLETLKQNNIHAMSMELKN